MIGQYLSQTNESTTVAKSKNFRKQLAGGVDARHRELTAAEAGVVSCRRDVGEGRARGRAPPQLL